MAQFVAGLGIRGSDVVGHRHIVHTVIITCYRLAGNLSIADPIETTGLPGKCQMVERIGSRDARRMFADLLGRVCYGGEIIMIERSGTPMAAMVPVELMEQLLAEHEARFEVLDRVRVKRQLEKDISDN